MINTKKILLAIIIISITIAITYSSLHRYLPAHKNPVATSEGSISTTLNNEPATLPESSTPNAQPSYKQYPIVELQSVQEIVELTHLETPLIIKCYTSWCPACHVASKAFPTINDHFKGSVRFYSLNVEDNDLVEALETNNLIKEPITSIPCFIFIDKKHDIMEQIKGFSNEKNMIEHITHIFRL